MTSKKEENTEDKRFFTRRPFRLLGLGYLLAANLPLLIILQSLLSVVETFRLLLLEAIVPLLLRAYWLRINSHQSRLIFKTRK